MPNLRLKLCSILLLHNFQVYRHIKVITVNGRYIQQFRPAARTPPNEYTNRLNLKKTIEVFETSNYRQTVRGAAATDQRDRETNGQTDGHPTVI